jgi:N-acetylglucosaminyl-diphospho-decaprenol L-rhamnosyltransferase
VVEPAAAGCPLLRVVVVTYNSGDSLAGFLDSIGPATARPVEVVVADNGSADGAPAKAQGRAQVRLLELGTNLGYGRAANAGATAPGGHTPWLLVANPDIVFESGSLDELLAATSRHPGAAALGPAIRTPAGQLYPSARNFPSLGRGLGHALVGWLWPANPWTRAYRNEQRLPAEGPVDWLSGSCLLLRRDAFEEVRGFDPAYFMYCEDMDLCRRLHEAGYGCVYVPSALVTHSGGHATRLHSTRMLAEHHRSMYRYLSRQYAGLRYVWLRPLLAAGLLARFVVATRVRRLREGAEPTRSARELGG